jgi:hypothetical protein
MMSRLKTKTINIQPSSGSSSSSAAAATQQEQGNSTLQNILSGMTGLGGGGGGDDISLDTTVINVSNLGDIPQDSTPHKSKRRPRSEKNTVSMDL